MSIMSEDFYQQLKKENEELHKELVDLNYLIQLREEELAEMKNASKHIAEMHSKINLNLYEFEQMQNFIETEQRKIEGAKRREENLEQEILDSIKIEKSYYEIREEFDSNKIALNDLNNQLKEALNIYKEVTILKSKISELESSLEIALLDNHFLKDDLAEKNSHEK